jgi:hypothetical protein
LTGYPAISLPAGGNTRTMQPLSARWAAGRYAAKSCPEKGHTRLQLQGGRKLYDDHAFEDMILTDDRHHAGAGGLHRRGRSFLLRQVPDTERSLFPGKDKAALLGRDRHPAECDCQRAQRMEREAAEQQRKHRDKVEELKRRGFTDPAMREWTFANDNGRNPQMKTAHFYVENWEDMKAGNIGYLLWGSVGTGKSYLAGLYRKRPHGA